MRVTAYLALGSNLGDRLAHLRAAGRALGAGRAVVVEARSGVFETAAVTDDPQPDYLNAVLRVATALSPRKLLETCLAVERALGRVRPAGVAKAPRTIDVDVLLHGDAVVEEVGLRLPHPGLLDRAFVRVPLAEVARNGLVHPITGTPLDSAGALADAGLRRLVEGL